MVPFFIVGSPRSGTTLLRDLLRSHPALGIPEESNFVPLAYQIWGEIRGDRDAHQILEHILTFPSLKHYWKVRSGEVLLPPSPTFAQLVSALFLAETGHKGRWGDKSPLYVKQIPLLNHLFPGAQIIHLIRDGRDVSLSAIKTDFGSPNLAQAMVQWRKAVLAGKRQGPHLGPQRYLEVRYEELLAEPEQQLRKLLAWLGEEFHPCVLTRTKATGVPGSLKVDAALSGRWRTAMSPDDLAICQGLEGPLLEALGYPLVGPSRPLDRTSHWRYLLEHKLSEKYRHFFWEGVPWLRQAKQLKRPELY